MVVSSDKKKKIFNIILKIVSKVICMLFNDLVSLQKQKSNPLMMVRYHWET